MFRALLERFKQGHRTAPYPRQGPLLPERFRGGPRLDSSRCPSDCRACTDICPTQALVRGAGGHPGAGEADGADRIRNHAQRLSLDMGRCLFCGECAAACPAGAVEFTREYRLSARLREDLWVHDRATPKACELPGELRRLLGRSLQLRQVSAGGCNACEADINVLSTIGFDLGRFGIQVVASPRHADGLLVTGPVTQNMRVALQKTYDALPPPRIVIAVGACAISGGPYCGHPETCDGLAGLLPVDLHVPGCPPHPYAILDGFLALLGRLPEARRAALVARSAPR